MTSYTNRRGNAWAYSYSEDTEEYHPSAPGTLNAAWSPVGGAGYDFTFRELQSYIDAIGHTWQATYAGGNMLSLIDQLAHEQNWTYDALNNLTSYTDADGNMVRYYYDDPAFPTLPTRIVEPNDALIPSNPPYNPDDLPDGYPVTRLGYYTSYGIVEIDPTQAAEDEYGIPGQLKEVIDPNGVWTGFSYDQWGQSNFYREGKLDGVVAGGGPVFIVALNNDVNSGGCHMGNNNGPGLGGGDSDQDSENNQTGSSCVPPALLLGDPPPAWFGFPLPCNAPDLPERSAQFVTASYGPRNELTYLPLDLDDGSNSHRNRSLSYDVMGRLKQETVLSNEAGGGDVIRTFDYDYDVLNGTYTRTGPDGPGGLNGNVTTVQLDAANRVQWIKREVSPTDQTLLMRADYTYLANDLVQSITYASGASIHYTYDEANRLTLIEHRNAIGQAMLGMVYTYHDNDLPETITETGSGLTPSTTTFTYDFRNRLIAEVRIGQSPYNLEYQYDPGGNRTMKIDTGSAERVEYHYDVTPDPGYGPQVYGSFNNRLMWSETINTDNEQLLRTTYYEYTPHGNVARVITAQPTGPQQQSMTGGGGGETAGGETESSSISGGGEEGGAPLWGGGGGGDTMYTAVRFVYAFNGRAVTFAHGESWTWDGVTWTCPAATSDYQIDWAREFRYDGARARYMNRSLDPMALMSETLTDIGTVWSDYDDDEIYGDFTVIGATATSTDKYEPGLWRLSATGLSEYMHNDHLGTLRRTSLSDGSPVTLRVFTAFGERKSGTHDRFGYVGAFGYQSHPTQPEFPFLHVGHRYYDPSSGRFLQRDPTGIRGGPNVFTYADSSPASAIDPFGLRTDPTDNEFWRRKAEEDRRKREEERRRENRRLNTTPVDPNEELQRVRRRIKDIKDSLKGMGTITGAGLGGPAGAGIGFLCGTLVPEFIESLYY